MKMKMKKSEDPDASIADIILTTNPQATLIDKYINKPISYTYKAITPIYFDTESVRGGPSEFVFAWLHSSEIYHVAPGNKGQNWWSRIRAKHFLRDKYWEHPGRASRMENRMDYVKSCLDTHRVMALCNSYSDLDIHKDSTAPPSRKASPTNKYFSELSNVYFARHRLPVRGSRHLRLCHYTEFWLVAISAKFFGISKP